MTGAAEYKASFSSKALPKITKEPTAQTNENLIADGNPKDLLADKGAAEGGTILFSVNDGAYSEAMPQGTEPGEYTIHWYVHGDDSHIDLGSEDEPKGTLTAVISKAAMKVKTEFVFLKNDSSRGLPSDIEELTLKPTVLIKKGKDTIAQSDPLEIDLTGKPRNFSDTITLSGSVEDLAPGKYTVYVKGLPKEMNDSFGDPSYKVNVKAEIHSNGGETVIMVYLIFQGLAEPEPVVVRELPEDEIGSYWILEDGTKQYLLFHTYDICMQWLGSDELCRGPERCYHK